MGGRANSLGVAAMLVATAANRKPQTRGKPPMQRGQLTPTASAIQNPTYAHSVRVQSTKREKKTVQKNTGDLQGGGCGKYRKGH